jgi:hypothetical protein
MPVNTVNNLYMLSVNTVNNLCMLSVNTVNNLCMLPVNTVNNLCILSKSRKYSPLVTVSYHTINQIFENKLQYKQMK